MVGEPLRSSASSDAWATWEISGSMLLGTGRAEQASAGHRLNPTNAKAHERLCEFLDGMRFSMKAGKSVRSPSR